MGGVGILLLLKLNTDFLAVTTALKWGGRCKKASTLEGERLSSQVRADGSKGPVCQMASGVDTAAATKQHSASVGLFPPQTVLDPSLPLPAGTALHAGDRKSEPLASGRCYLVPWQDRPTTSWGQPGSVAQGQWWSLPAAVTDPGMGWGRGHQTVELGRVKEE